MLPMLISICKIVDLMVNPNQEIGMRYRFEKCIYIWGMVLFAKIEEVFSLKFYYFDCRVSVTLVDQGFLQRQVRDRILIYTIIIPITI